LFTPPFITTCVLKNNVDEGTGDEIRDDGIFIYFTQSHDDDGVHDSDDERF
jgi:hypothetical protein